MPIESKTEIQDIPFVVGIDNNGRQVEDVYRHVTIVYPPETVKLNIRPYGKEQTVEVTVPGRKVDIGSYPLKIAPRENLRTFTQSSRAMPDAGVFTKYSYPSTNSQIPSTYSQRSSYPPPSSGYNLPPTTGNTYISTQLPSSSYRSNTYVPTQLPPPSYQPNTYIPPVSSPLPYMSQSTNIPPFNSY